MEKQAAAAARDRVAANTIDGVDVGRVGMTLAGLKQRRFAVWPARRCSVAIVEWLRRAVVEWRWVRGLRGVS